MTPEWPCHLHAQQAKEPGDKDFPYERTVTGLRCWQKTQATRGLDSPLTPEGGEVDRGTDETTELQRQALSTVAVDSQLQEAQTYKVSIEPRLGITSSGMGAWGTSALPFSSGRMPSEVMSTCRPS